MSQKTLPPPDLVAGWDTRHVADWLRLNDMPDFITPFRINNVDGLRLLELDENKIKLFNVQVSPQKIIKLLDKVRKSKKERTGLFNKLKQSRYSVPAVPDRDYKKSTNSCQKAEDDDGGWGSDFDDDELEDNYEPPPDPKKSEAQRYPQPLNHSQFNSQVENRYIDDDDDDDEDCAEDYIVPIETVHFEEDFEEDQYLAPDSADAADELYEVPEDDSHFQPRIPTIKPPARPPKTNKDFICKQSRQLPQMLVPAPSLNAVPIDVPPRPPARRSASPARTPCSPRPIALPVRAPYSYQPPEIQDDYEEDTYDAPNIEQEDSDETYAVPDDASLNQRPVQPHPDSIPSSRPRPNKPPNLMKHPARLPIPPPSPKNKFNSSSNDKPSVAPPIIRYPKTDSSQVSKEPPIIRSKAAFEPPIIRYPKTDTSKAAKEPPIIKTDDTPASGVSKMKQVFEQRSPTLPRKDVCNGTNQESFLHKRQPPLPSPLLSKNELSPKEPKASNQPQLPRRKPLLSHKIPALPDSNPTSSSLSKMNDSTKPSPAQRNPPSPAQRTTLSPAQRNPPTSPSHQNPHTHGTPRSEQNSMDGYPWYHADIPRDKAQKSLEDFRRDGAFLVRESKRGGHKNPFTLSLWYNNQVRNLQMRRRVDDKYALGSMKEGEQTFESPLELVEFHQTNPLILANNEGKTKLKQPCPVF